MRILAPTLIALTLAACAGEEEREKDEHVPTKADYYPPAEMATPTNSERVEACLNAVTNALVMIGGAMESVNSKTCDASKADVDEAREMAGFTESACAGFSPEVKLIIDELLRDMALNLEVLNDHFGDKCEMKEERRKCDLVLSLYRNIARIALEAARSGNCELVGKMVDELKIALERTKKDCVFFLYSDLGPETDAVIDETQAISAELMRLVEENCPPVKGPKKVPEKIKSPPKLPSKPSKRLDPMPGHARDMRTLQRVQNSRRG